MEGWNPGRALAGVAATLALSSMRLLSGPAVLTFACEDKPDFPNILGEGQEIDDRHPGASIEFIQLLGQELGFQVAIKRLPWKRALELELKTGAVDGLFPVSYRKDREPFGEWPTRDGRPDDSRSMFASSYFFYKARGSALEWDGRALRNLQGPIGASRGYSVVGDLEGLGYDVQESDDARKDLLRLVQGRLGAVAGLEAAEDHLLEASPELAGDVVKLQPAISTKRYFLVLSRSFVQQNPGLAERIWDKCRELRERELPKLMRKYVGR